MTDTELPAISHLSLESKRALLARLVRELTVNTFGSTSVTDAQGEVMFYRVPNNAKQIAEEHMRSLTAEEVAELRRRALDTENTFSFEEALNLPWDQDSDSTQSPSARSQ
jgi:hypothetical protein